jgi:hypothetical protein
VPPSNFEHFLTFCHHIIFQDYCLRVKVNHLVFLVPLIGKWYLEMTIWGLGVLITIGVSLILGRFRQPNHFRWLFQVCVCVCVCVCVYDKVHLGTHTYLYFLCPFVCLSIKSMASHWYQPNPTGFILANPFPYSHFLSYTWYLIKLATLLNIFHCYFKPGMYMTVISELLIHTSVRNTLLIRVQNLVQFLFFDFSLITHSQNTIFKSFLCSFLLHPPQCGYIIHI